VKHDRSLLVSSLISIALLLLHVADDVVRGFEPGTLENYGLMPIAVAWLYAAVVLYRRRSGYVALLLPSLLGAAIPILHMRGRGLGGKLAASDGALLFIWTNFAIGTLGLFSLILCLHGLWSTRRGAIDSAATTAPVPAP
jgi:hypothetical protein